MSMQFVRSETWEKIRLMLKGYETGRFSIVDFDLHSIIHKGRHARQFSLTRYPTYFHCRAGLCFSPSSTHQHRRVFVDTPQIASAPAEWDVGSVVLNACDSAKISSSESSNLAKVFNPHGIDKCLIVLLFPWTNSTLAFFWSATISNVRCLLPSYACGQIQIDLLVTLRV